MKTIKIYTVLLCLLVCTSNAFGQKKDKKVTQSLAYKTGNPADWAANLDAVIAAPKNHKVLLENDKVRVLEVTLLPGETENIHHHRWPSVLYIQDAGDFIDYDAKGNIILDTRKVPPLKLPMTMWKEPEAPHYVKNLSNTITLRLIRVETKQ